MPALDPKSLTRSTACLDFSDRKTIHFQRYSQTAELTYAFIDAENKKGRIPFPKHTRGYLYYHCPQNSAVDGDLRFRITPDGRPSSFDRGADLCTPDGQIWSVPFERIVADPKMKAFRDKLVGPLVGRAPKAAQSTAVEPSVVIDLTPKIRTVSGNQLLVTPS